MRIRNILTGLSGGILLALGLPLSVSAATTTVVTPSNTQGWSSADTRTGGTVSFVGDSSSPLPMGALKLVTDSTTTSKAQYMREAASIPLSQITTLGYATKQNAASFADGTASYQLVVNVAGTTGYTTFVYEPYNNSQSITPGTWQTWDVDAGQFWSSRDVTCSGGNFTAGGGGAPFYTLNDIKTKCPEAVVLGYGVNIGSNNPGYDIETDAVVFNDVTYDFEALLAPVITLPANNASLTSAQLDKVDWTDITGATTYQYEAYSDVGYNNLVFSSVPLNVSEIPTPSTPAGEYYVRVRATDANGNTSVWSNGASNPYHITVTNQAPPPTPVTLLSKEECKNDGWKTSTNPKFKNQGDCVSSFASKGRAGGNPVLATY